MHRYLLPASIAFLGLAVLADRLVPAAHADTPSPGVVCEEGFRTPTGINRNKVEGWLTEQRGLGRTNFLPFGVQGSVGMICAW